MVSCASQHFDHLVAPVRALRQDAEVPSGEFASKLLTSREKLHVHLSAVSTREELDLNSEASSEESTTSVISEEEEELDAPPRGDDHADEKTSTVIIFDWDDTLLASSAIQQLIFSREEMQELEDTVRRVLLAARALGETLIVTNASESWVEESAKLFLPGLLPLLSELKVVSAQALYGHQHPGDPFMWKRRAFEHLLTEARRFPAGLNLVALGDQYPELDAAHYATRAVGGASQLKTVKFRDQPTVAELIGQLRKVEESLGEIVESSDLDWNQDLKQRRDRAYPVSHPSSWRLRSEKGSSSSTPSTRSSSTPTCVSGVWTLLGKVWRVLADTEGGRGVSVLPLLAPVQ